jgi:hypothetical protein
VGLLSWLGVNYQGTTPNANPPSSVGDNGWVPGDPDGVVIDPVEELAQRSLSIMASPWSGWPSEWSTPEWSTIGDKLNSMVDTAWACLDLNSSVMAAMPPYRTQSGQTVSSLSWMDNPDPDVYTSWYEFAKQFWWDYQLGEAFVLASEWFANGYPSRFKVVPPNFVKVKMAGPRRTYFIGQTEVTDEILHVRYQSTSMETRGRGPLSMSGPRMVASTVLSRYLTEMASAGGVPDYIIEVERKLSKPESDDLVDQWMDSRKRAPNAPAIVSGKGTAKPMTRPTAKDMAYLEVAQFVESRIAVMLGVPPYLVGLPSGGDPMTYANQTGLFDFHDRSSLRPKAVAGIQALSFWALPRGQAIELNRDEYTRPTFLDRTQGYKNLSEIPGALTGEEVRKMERFTSDVAPTVLTGGDA